MLPGWRARLPPGRAAPQLALGDEAAAGHGARWRPPPSMGADFRVSILPPGTCRSIAKTRARSDDGPRRRGLRSDVAVRAGPIGLRRGGVDPSATTRGRGTMPQDSGRGVASRRPPCSVPATTRPGRGRGGDRQRRPNDRRRGPRPDRRDHPRHPIGIAGPNGTYPVQSLGPLPGASGLRIGPPAASWRRPLGAGPIPGGPRCKRPTTGRVRPRPCRTQRDRTPGSGRRAGYQGERFLRSSRC